MNIRKDDKVVVLSGKDKGKQGKVLVAEPKTGKVIVEGVNVATKHKKPTKQGEDGGIKPRFMPAKFRSSAPSAAREHASDTKLKPVRKSVSARSAALKSEKGD